MSSIVVAGDTSGTVTLQAPSVAGTTTLTLPSTSGTVLTSASTTMPATSVNQAAIGTNVVGTGVAFSAYKTVSQSISSSTFTKITFPSEDYDTNSNFDNATNYRFTPTVAGYYLIGAGYNAAGGGVPSRTILDIYKNGNQVKRLFDTSTRCDNASGTVMLYLNGSTDYLEVYAYIVASSPQIYGAASDTFFTGVLVRAA